MTPSVTVILPVYNAEPFLKEAIDSILNQTYEDFELLVFEDGSTDNSPDIIRTFVDKRIQTIFSSENMGYIYHLNEGLKKATGRYIIRMDADDICDHQRFEKQVSFMEENPSIGVCGTQIVIINDSGNIIEEVGREIEDDQLRARLLLNSCFAHPSVIFRRDLLMKNNLFYDRTSMPAEDYALWTELATLTKFANLPEVLLKYRNHGNQVSIKKRMLQQQMAGKVRVKNIERFLGRKLNETESVLHNSLCDGNYVATREYVTSSRTWIESLIDRGKLGKEYNLRLLEEEMGRIWFGLCTHSYKLGWWVVFIFFSAKIHKKTVRFLSLTKFLMKSITGFSPFHR